MLYKTKEEQAAYMREYRKRIKEAVGLSDKALDKKIQEYREKGLDKDDLFMDMLYRWAMQGKNPRYAELYWKITRPEEKEELDPLVINALARSTVKRMKEDSDFKKQLNCLFYDKPCPYHHNYKYIVPKWKQWTPPEDRQKEVSS